MSAHSRILAWKTPMDREPGRLQSMGLHRIGHDLMTEQQNKNVLAYELYYSYTDDFKN